jgi:hypothetical protein
MGLKRSPLCQVSAGDTFLVVAPFNHLYVVCSDPAADPVQVLIVNFTTFRPKEETCCIVTPGEHAFIRHRSCVRYKDARIVPVKSLIALLDSAQMSRREPVSKELLARIRGGASNSEYLPEECRRFLKNQSLI